MMQILTFLPGRRYAVCLTLLCCTSFLSAQMLDIQGIVTGESGEPLIGVTVRVVNSTDRGRSLFLSFWKNDKKANRRLLNLQV